MMKKVGRMTPWAGSQCLRQCCKSFLPQQDIEEAANLILPGLVDGRIYTIADCHYSINFTMTISIRSLA
jgi:hypothetical protein